MPTPIRARLLLMMMTVLLPGMGAALYVVARTYQSERDGLQRSLRDSALAMAQVIDRELARRADIAQALATSQLLARRPDDGHDLLALHAWCSRITRDLGGWVELHSAGQLLMDTRLPAGMPPQAHGGFALSAVPRVVPLAVDAKGRTQPPQLVQPLRTGRGELLNIVVTLPPDVLQRVVDHQRLPPTWVGAVVDNGQQVVARHPGGAAYIGRLVTPDLRDRLASAVEGAFTSVTLDGVPSVGHFSKTPQGWSYLAASPSPVAVADLPLPVLQVLAGALLLLGSASGAALWVGRGIAGAAESMTLSARALQSGAPVPRPAPTGVAEFDAVGIALAEAAAALGRARQDMERQVAAAVARTRLAEQRAAQGQRIAALGRLTGGVAHEFNNLLGVISNSAHLIALQVPQNPALRMPVDVTQRAVQMGSQLSQQLLRFSGRQAASPRLVDLAAWLPELLVMLKIVTGGHVRMDLVVAPGTGLVKVDPSELELALVHIAFNAQDAMPKGGQLQVLARPAQGDETEGLPPGHYVLLALSDNGVGLSDADVAQVFDPFFTTKGVGQGAGLGLSQVHGFCVQAGGMARMASTPGLGSTVSLLLPTAAPDRAASTVPAAPPDMPANPGRLLAGATVLVVEDNDALAEVTALVLESHGCTVRRARQVDDALARIAADRGLQLVLTDVVMPGARNGVDLAQELARTRPQLPVVLISGYSTSLAGLTGFTVLRKPVSADRLVRALADALRAAALPAQAGSA